MMRNGINCHGRPLWMNSCNLLARRNYARQVSTSNRSQTRGRRFVIDLGIAVAFVGTTVTIYSTFIHERIFPRTSFQEYRVESKEPCSPNSAIFKLKPETSVDWSKEWQQGLWSIEIKQPQLQIAREYTPLPPALLTDKLSKEKKHPRNRDALEFWIRRDGEVSTYLHKIESDSVVELRGPRSQTVIPDAQEFLFLAGGTGISPALQLCHALLVRTPENAELPKVHILWANKQRDDCAGGISDNKIVAKPSLWKFWQSAPEIPIITKKSPLVERLEKLKDAFEGRLQIDYFVDNEGSRIQGEHVVKQLRACKDSASEKVVMVCGPEGFVAHFAGPKLWENGRQVQGAIGGVLKGAPAYGWEVIKL